MYYCKGCGFGVAWSSTILPRRQWLRGTVCLLNFRKLYASLNLAGRVAITKNLSRKQMLRTQKNNQTFTTFPKILSLSPPNIKTISSIAHLVRMQWHHPGSKCSTPGLILQWLDTLASLLIHTQRTLDRRDPRSLAPVTNGPWKSTKCNYISYYHY